MSTSLTTVKNVSFLKNTPGSIRSSFHLKKNTPGSIRSSFHFKSPGSVKFESVGHMAATQAVAIRLGHFRPSPFRPLSRTDITSLNKVLKMQTLQQFVTKIASGSFAHVYKFKRIKGLPSCWF